MERWYVLYTVSGREQESAELLMRTASRSLWSECRIPKKLKVFRSGGILHLVEGVMFPGYLFVKTPCPNELSEYLLKARKFPHFIGGSSRMITPVEEKDMEFLMDVCGENLQQVMGVTQIVLNEENRIVKADGVLWRYRDKIVRLNLHRRFAVVEVELFNRRQKVLFGVKLRQDYAV